MTWYQKVGLHLTTPRRPSDGLMQIVEHAPWRENYSPPLGSYSELMKRYAHNISYSVGGKL